VNLLDILAKIEDYMADGNQWQQKDGGLLKNLE
jgi:hypothetical protein